MKGKSKGKALAAVSMKRTKGLKSNKKGMPRGSVPGVGMKRGKCPGKSPTKLW